MGHQVLLIVALLLVFDARTLSETTPATGGAGPCDIRDCLAQVNKSSTADICRTTLAALDCAFTVFTYNTSCTEEEKMMIQKELDQGQQLFDQNCSTGMCDMQACLAKVNTSTPSDICRTSPEALGCAVQLLIHPNCTNFSKSNIQTHIDQGVLLFTESCTTAMGSCDIQACLRKIDNNVSSDVCSQVAEVEDCAGQTLLTNANCTYNEMSFVQYIIQTRRLRCDTGPCDIERCRHMLDSNSMDDICRTLPEVLVCAQTNLNNGNCSETEKMEAESQVAEGNELLQYNCSTDEPCGISRCLNKINMKSVAYICRTVPYGIACAQLYLLNNPNCSSDQLVYIRTRIAEGKYFFDTNCKTVQPACDLETCLKKVNPDDMCRTISDAISCANVTLATNPKCTEDDEMVALVQMEESMNILNTRCATTTGATITGERTTCRTVDTKASDVKCAAGVLSSLYLCLYLSICVYFLACCRLS